MREQDLLAALVLNFGDGRGDALDARGIRHLAVLHRHVEVDADEHALAREVSLIKCFERHASYSFVIPGLVPGIPLRRAQCVTKRDGRGVRAFTPVFDGLCPAMTWIAWS